MFELEDKTRIAVRGSGPNPRSNITFSRSAGLTNRSSLSNYHKSKWKRRSISSRPWSWLQQDAHARLA